ncbi:hypothetical protein A6V25_31515 [Nostoc sp. ATCC 53789]|nr:hypothetical protein A6V25_31515 [Nostoc sp. ATCC 53789]
MNFQYEWDDTFEEDLLKLRASVVNPSTEASTDNFLLQKSVHCSKKFYYYYSNCGHQRIRGRQLSLQQNFEKAQNSRCSQGIGW